MIKKIFLFVLFYFSLTQLAAQYFLSGQDAASIRWKQMKTQHFKIIFPQNNLKDARYVAGLLETGYPHLRAGLNAPAKFTPLILHTGSVISNATTAWAPRRLDFFHTPPQDGYAQEWFKQLSLHELEHVVQFSSLEKGFGKVIYALTGQQGAAAIMGLFVPTWFLEGDAVVTETAFSSSGRGRQALFLSGLQAQLVEKEMFSYDKAYFGSYKDHVPDVYELGYVLVGFNKQKFGNGLWSHVMDRTARRPWTLNPFSAGLKDVTGQGKNKLYKSTMVAMQDYWREMETLQTDEFVRKISPEKKVYSQYRSPQNLTDQSIVAIKTSLADRPAIVSIHNRKEKVVFRPGAMLHHQLSGNDSLVVWSEFQPHFRWSNLNYSVLQLGNLNSGKVRRLTSKSRLFAPNLSLDNSRIVAVDATDTRGSALVILSAETGETLTRFTSDSMFFTTPLWLADGKEIVFAAIGSQGKSIWKLSLPELQLEQVSPATFTFFALTDVVGDDLLIQGDWLGKSEIYSYNISIKTLYLLSRSRFGAADPQAGSDGNSILFADYSSAGFALSERKVDGKKKLKVDFSSQAKFFPADTLSRMSHFNLDKSFIEEVQYEVKDYKKLAHLFHFHSYSPVYLQVDNQDFAPGVSLFSQNDLSTMVAELGYRYDVNEQTGKMIANLTYLGLFPELGLGFGYGLRRGKAFRDGQLYDLKWFESDWSFSASVPFDFSRMQWLRGFRPSVSYRLVSRKMEPNMPPDFSEKKSQSLTYGLYYYNQTRRAQRDIYPKFGQSLQVVYRHSPFDTSPAWQLYSGIQLFFPGMIANHGIRLSGAYQSEMEGFTSFSSIATFPRGYENLSFDEVATFKTDYVFPLGYPEWNWPTIYYLKRIKGGFFVDYLHGNMLKNSDLISAGLELQGEMYFFNLPAPVELGVRLIYREAYGDWVPELLLGLNISSLY